MSNKNKAAQKSDKRPNIFIRILRFFVPKNFHAELYKGMQFGQQIKRGKVSPKVVPSWWIGKGLRKTIDPKHKLFFGKDKTSKDKQK